MNALKMIPKELLCHEMHFYDVFCRHFTVSVEEYVFHLTASKTYQFLALTLILLFAIDPFGLRGNLPIGYVLLIWIVAMMVFLGMCCILVLTYIGLGTKFPKIKIFSWMISLGGYFPAHWTAVELAVDLSNGLYTLTAAIQTGFLALAIVMIETIYFRFVMPHAAAGRPRPAPLPDDSARPQATITIGTRTVRREVLQYIVSEEHYVRVVMGRDTIVQRARLADLVAQMTFTDGVQPHRSWWVSTNAKPRMTRKDGKRVLVLADGTLVPIARGRIKDTQAWIDAHANWNTGPASKQIQDAAE